MSDDPQKLTPPIEPETDPEPEETTDPEPVEEPQPEEKEDPLKIWITEVTTRLDNLTEEVKRLAPKPPPENPAPAPTIPPKATPPQSPKRKRPQYRWWFQKD